MSFKILYVTATESEAEALKNVKGIVAGIDSYGFGAIEIALLVAGIGSVSTAWSMKQWISVNEKPDLAINAGIAGSYNDNIGIGDVLMPCSDCFADAGIEDGNNFRTLSEAGLVGANEFPFNNGILVSDPFYNDKLKNLLRHVKAITVNTATGSESSRLRLINKFNPDIETMEGAAFFYICIREKIPFLAIRAISNRVEPRDKRKWDINLALTNLSGKLEEVLFTLK